MGTKKTILRPDISAATSNNFSEVVATREIDIATLNIDPSYQRSDFLNMTVVNKIGAEFSLVRFNVLIVAQRADGSLWVVDGQHRYFGAIKAGQKTVPCRVFSSQGPQQEASVFYDLNKTRTSINAISMYRALLRQDEATSVAIQALLDKYNFSIGKGGKRAFQAASAIREVYKRGVLEEVLRVIDQSFGDGSTQRWRMMFAQSHFIQMLGLIYQQKKDEIDSDRMTLVLARMDEKAYNRMSASSAGTTGGRAKRIAPVFIEEFYNKQLSVKNKVVW